MCNFCQGQAGEQRVSLLLQVPLKNLFLPSILANFANARSIDGRNFTLEKMARSLFGEDICWANPVPVIEHRPTIKRKILLSVCCSVRPYSVQISIFNTVKTKSFKCSLFPGYSLSEVFTYIISYPNRQREFCGSLKSLNLFWRRTWIGWIFYLLILRCNTKSHENLVYVNK